MSRSRQRSSRALVVLGLVALCIVLWLLRGAIDPEPTAPAPIAATAAARPAATVLPAPLPALPELARAEPLELRGQDTVDPCTAGFEPTIPPGYDTVTADSVTVAWLPAATPRTGAFDVAVAPTAVAYLVNGLLAEAAALTGTFRRERLAVIVYPSREALHAATRAPAWAGGIYDGGAVRIAASPSDDLGVEIVALRHELMHAQLHTAVGCMPSWFNEGLAMYFAGAPPIRTWLRMLRSPDAYDLRSLQVPTFAMMTDEQAERAYAESLAMVVMIVERAGELGLRTAVQTLRTATRDAPRAGLELWDNLYPGTGHRELLDGLAHRVFAAGSRSDVDRIFQGAVCCSGLRAVAELRCHGTAPRSDRRRWTDQTSTPRAVCDTTW
ncbi:MAG: hypothetical protein E6J90_23950 [Deltaproteobacteria bacterium]|nr:MAG: hypothetical protein E6J91_15025 [Deltaproteobacteria bacterium]TMQ16441.1 MAG: hypothetical protein E6J90_23950 [Deltaproteobacteria bacterium]